MKTLNKFTKLEKLALIYGAFFLVPAIVLILTKII